MIRRLREKIFKKPPRCAYNPRAGYLNPKENWEEIHKLVHHNAERIAALEGKMVILGGSTLLILGLVIARFFVA